MKICNKCKHIHNDEELMCNECKRPLEIIEDENTPVYILSAEGFELSRVRTALEDNGVPCDVSAKKKNISAEAVTGYDSSEYDLLVPYSAYEKAYDICVGIGAINEGEAEILDDDGQPLENVKTATEEFEEMSGVKRTTIRVISATLLIVIFCMVIWGTDYIMEFIKYLFGN
ncbi:MAG: hypothetical protein J1E85_08280 [Ruminococcus sp.]|nr:hypothetical protein [Ruminococcus sp.]